MGGIMNLINYEAINPEALFGKDAQRMLNACDKAKRNWIHPYDGCYRANYPGITELKKILVIPEGSSFGTECKAFLKQWYAEHPEEEAKEKASRKEWENQRDKQFKIIFGIAKRHGLYIKWHGNSNPCCGDQWDVYKNNQRIARICC